MFGRCCLLCGGVWFGFGWGVLGVGCLFVGVGVVACGWWLWRVGLRLFRGWSFWGLFDIRRIYGILVFGGGCCEW